MSSRARAEAGRICALEMRPEFLENWRLMKLQLEL